MENSPPDLPPPERLHEPSRIPGMAFVEALANKFDQKSLREKYYQKDPGLTESEADLYYLYRPSDFQAEGGVIDHELSDPAFPGIRVGLNKKGILIEGKQFIKPSELLSKIRGNYLKNINSLRPAIKETTVEREIDALEMLRARLHEEPGTAVKLKLQERVNTSQNLLIDLYKAGALSKDQIKHLQKWFRPLGLAFQPKTTPEEGKIQMPVPKDIPEQDRIKKIKIQRPPIFRHKFEKATAETEKFLAAINTERKKLADDVAYGIGERLLAADYKGGEIIKKFDPTPLLGRIWNNKKLRLAILTSLELASLSVATFKFRPGDFEMDLKLMINTAKNVPSSFESISRSAQAALDQSQEALVNFHKEKPNPPIVSVPLVLSASNRTEQFIPRESGQSQFQSVTTEPSKSLNQTSNAVIVRETSPLLISMSSADVLERYVDTKILDQRFAFKGSPESKSPYVMSIYDLQENKKIGLGDVAFENFSSLVRDTNASLVRTSVSGYTLDEVNQKWGRTTDLFKIAHASGVEARVVIVASKTPSRGQWQSFLRRAITSASPDHVPDAITFGNEVGWNDKGSGDLSEADKGKYNRQYVDEPFSWIHDKDKGLPVYLFDLYQTVKEYNQRHGTNVKLSVPALGWNYTTEPKVNNELKFFKALQDAGVDLNDPIIEFNYHGFALIENQFGGNEAIQVMAFRNRLFDLGIKNPTINFDEAWFATGHSPSELRRLADFMTNIIKVNRFILYPISGHWDRENKGE